MKFCQQCGTQVKDSDLVCPLCGAAITGNVVREVVSNPNAIPASNPENFKSYGNGVDSSATQNPYGATQNPYDTAPNPYGTAPNPHGTTPNPYGTTPNPYNNSQPMYQVAPEKKGSIVLGILGAIVGFIFVALLWLLFTRMGYIVYIQGLLLVYVPFFLYSLFRKKKSIISLVVICIVALLLVYPIALTCNLIDIKASWNEEVEDFYEGDEDLIREESIQSLSEAYELYPSIRQQDKEYDQGQTKVYVISYISAIIGVVLAILAEAKNRN